MLISKKDVSISFPLSRCISDETSTSERRKRYRDRMPSYCFMQLPGRFNALGKIKYLFPNEYAV